MENKIRGKLKFFYLSERFEDKINFACKRDETRFSNFHQYLGFTSSIKSYHSNFVWRYFAVARAINTYLPQKLFVTKTLEGTNSEVYCLNLTWESLSPNFSANFFLSGLEMYFWIWNRFSSPFLWRSENTARLIIPRLGFPLELWAQGNVPGNGNTLVVPGPGRFEWLLFEDTEIKTGFCSALWGQLTSWFNFQTNSWLRLYEIPAVLPAVFRTTALL